MMNLSVSLGLAIMAAGLQGGDEFDSDRPTFSGTPTALAQGVLQIEAGATFSREDDDVDIFGFPELLVRYGMGNGLEIQFDAPQYLIMEGGADTEGWTDAGIGVKYELQGLPSGIRAALVPRLSITTDGTFSDDESRFGVALPWTYANSQQPLFGSFTFLDGEDDNLFGANVGVRLAEMSGWSPFVEYGGAFQKDFGPSHVLHLGAQKRQGVGALDFHFGFGLNDRAPDFFIGAGFTTRF